MFERDMNRPWVLLVNMKMDIPEWSDIVSKCICEEPTTDLMTDCVDCRVVMSSLDIISEVQDTLEQFIQHHDAFDIEPDWDIVDTNEGYVLDKVAWEGVDIYMIHEPIDTSWVPDFDPKILLPVDIDLGEGTLDVIDEYDIDPDFNLWDTENGELELSID